MRANQFKKYWIAVVAGGAIFCGATGALAQAGDGTRQSDPKAAASALAPTVVEGTPTYRVGYMASTTTSPRKAMAISITNNSALPCDTTVNWRAGGGQLIGSSSITIGAGQTLEHCSRTLPDSLVICNVTSAPEVAEPQFVEGKAEVFLAPGCRASANVDAKQYYMANDIDANLVGVYRPATIRGTHLLGD